MVDSDRLLLEAAVTLAEGGRYTCAPNPTVGCIIVRQGQIVGRGYHARTGEGHAEVQAIADAGGEISGATVYVSLEPCAFVGRTPACAQTLIDAGVGRVVIAALDPHPQVAGQGVAMLKSAGVDVTVIELESARMLIRGYVSRLLRQRPWVRLKTATSMDGAVALASGESQWITGEAARVDVQRWRARSDAIVTGIGTILSDDPRLTVRLTEPCQAPLRVILDSDARTPHDAQVVTDQVDTLIVHHPRAQPEFANPHVTCLSLDPGHLEAVLTELAERGCNEVLIEAGPKVVGSFVAQGLWDEWVAYVAPKILGSSSRPVADFALTHLSDAPQAIVTAIDQIGHDMRITMESQSG